MSGRLLSRRNSITFRAIQGLPGISIGASGWVALTSSLSSVGIDITDAVPGEWIYLYAASGMPQSEWDCPGWTLLDSGNTASSGYALFRYKKLADDTVMVLSYGASTRVVAGWQQYIGLHATTPDQPTPPASLMRSSSSAISSTGTAVSASDSWAVSFFYSRSSTSANKEISFTLPAELTPRVTTNNVDATSAPWVGIALADSNGPVVQAPHSYQAAASFAEMHGGGTLLYLIPSTSDPDPDPGPDLDKVLPGTIDGITPESNDFIGPVMDANGNMYAITESNLANDNQPRAMKSADGGQTWAEMDAVNRPTTSDTEAVWIVKDVVTASLVHVAHMDSGGRISYHSYRMSDHSVSPDTWLTKGEAVHSGSSPDASDQCLVLVQRTTGELLIFYRTDPETVNGSSYERIAYRRKASGGAWSGQVFIESGVETSFEQVSAVRSDNDKIHLFYKNMTSGEIRHRSLSANNVLSASEVVNDSSISTKRHLMTNAVCQNINGVERVSIAWLSGSGEDKLMWSYLDDDGAPSPEQQVSPVAIARDPGLTGNFSTIAFLAVDGPTVHAIYADKATQDIWHTSNTSLSGWTTPVKISNDVTAQWLFANIFSHSTLNGGKKVIGYIYDDNGLDDDGEIRYDELEL